MKNTACNNCKGSLHCFNFNSPCYLNYCGIYPGTGPRKDGEKKETSKK